MKNGRVLVDVSGSQTDKALGQLGITGIAVCLLGVVVLVVGVWALLQDNLISHPPSIAADQQRVESCWIICASLIKQQLLD